MKLLVIALLLLVPSFSHANSYDDDEKIRRAAQKLVDEDKRQREAAKERADRVEQGLPANPIPYNNPGSPLALVLVFGVVLGGIGWFIHGIRSGKIK